MGRHRGPRRHVFFVGRHRHLVALTDRRLVAWRTPARWRSDAWRARDRRAGPLAAAAGRAPDRPFFQLLATAGDSTVVIELRHRDHAFGARSGRALGRAHAPADAGPTPTAGLSGRDHRWPSSSRSTPAPPGCAPSRSTPPAPVAPYAYREFPQHFPRPGWVEHDPLDIRDAALGTLAEVVAALDGEPVAGIGITNQRETVVVWDRDTGEPLHRALGVAGPPHRGALHRTARRGARAPRARADRPRARPVLQRDQARVVAARGRRPGVARRSRSAPSTRGCCGASPASTRPSRRTRPARCCSTSTRSTGPTSCARLFGVDRRSSPRGAPEQRPLRASPIPSVPPGCACRCAASPATSRPRCSARRASRRA